MGTRVPFSATPRNKGFSPSFQEGRTFVLHLDEDFDICVYRTFSQALIILP